MQPFLSAEVFVVNPKHGVKLNLGGVAEVEDLNNA